MNKAKLIFLLCTLTAAAWSLPGALLRARYPHAMNFGGGSWFDGH